MLTLLKQHLISRSGLAALCLSGLLLSMPVLVMAQEVKVNYLTRYSSSGGWVQPNPPLAAQDGNLYYSGTSTSVSGTVGYMMGLRYLNTFPSPVVGVVGSYPAKPNCAQAAGLEPGSPF